MTLKCSAEPKRRDVAQITVFAAETEPLWRKDRMHPKGQEADFGIVQRRDTLKSRYLNISPQTGQQNGGNRSRDTAETSPGVRLQVQAVE